MELAIHGIEDLETNLRDAVVGPRDGDGDGLALFASFNGLAFYASTNGLTAVSANGLMAA